MENEADDAGAEDTDEVPIPPQQVSSQVAGPTPPLLLVRGIPLGYEQSLENVRRQDVLPRLSNDSLPVCFVGYSALDVAGAPSCVSDLPP